MGPVARLRSLGQESGRQKFFDKRDFDDWRCKVIWVVVSASINTFVGCDVMTFAHGSSRQNCVFLVFFASTGLHGPHSSQIERHAHELELGPCLL